MITQSATYEGYAFTRVSPRRYTHVVVVAVELVDARLRVIADAKADAVEVAQGAAVAAGGVTAYVKQRLALFEEALTRARLSADKQAFYRCAGWCTRLDLAVKLARQHARSYIVEVA